MQVRCPAPRRNELALRHFPDGTVVYDEASGSLHALSPVAGQALSEILTHERLSLPDLAARIQLDHPSSDELRQLGEMVEQLSLLGFVECLSV
jgi:hypothetical protein